jgi:hypothetical protein
VRDCAAVCPGNVNGPGVVLVAIGVFGLFCNIA